MSFRQHNKRAEVLWRRKHREELLSVGLPEEIVDDERRWNYTLLHGDEYGWSEWNPFDITKEQAERLLRLLRSQPFWTGTSYSIYGELEKRIRKENSN
jgi:hypothetical protein